MFKSAKPLFLIVETSLHAGSGSDLGIVDLPIQREKHTDYPKIEASGIKGAIREVFSTQPNLKTLGRGWGIDSIDDANYKEAINLAFGPDTTHQNNLHAGALGFTDARLLLFPVKSVSGVFGWITCPAVLERFKQDLSICQPNITFDFSFLRENQVPTDSELIVNDNEIVLENQVPTDSELIVNDNRIVLENQVPTDSELIVNDNRIVLEEYTFEVQKTCNCKKLADWIAENCMPSDDVYEYWRAKIKTSLIVLSDEDFRDFVTLSTEVIARIKIDQNTGTVQKRALWYEEYLPSDSILYSLALASPIFQANDKDKGVFQLTEQESENRDESEKVIKFLEDGLPHVIQLGGNATIGKGIVRTKIWEIDDDATD